ncbi:MAG: hypothetical protein P8188_04225 [Gemmatimonadota bacterium]
MTPRRVPSPLGATNGHIRFRFLLLVLLTLGSPVATWATPFQARVGPEAVGPTLGEAPARFTGARDPEGAGVWDRAACVVCAASFVAVGGTSVLGLAAVAFS